MELLVPLPADQRFGPKLPKTE